MKQDTIIFKLDRKVKEQLMKEARAKGLSMSSYIRLILINRGNKNI